MYYTTDPTQPEQSWESQVVDNSELTTISELSEFLKKNFSRIVLLIVSPFSSLENLHDKNPSDFLARQWSA